MFTGYKTFLGAFIAMAPAIAKLFGFELTSNFTNEIGMNIDDIVVLIGGAIAIYGRLKAQSPGWLVSK